MKAGRATTVMNMDNTIITFPASMWLLTEYGIKTWWLDTSKKAPKRPIVAFIKKRLKIIKVVGIILTAIRLKDPVAINDAC